MDIDTTHEGSKEDEGVNNVDLEEIPLLVDLSVFDDLDDIEVEKRLENTRDFHDQVCPKFYTIFCNKVGIYFRKFEIVLKFT